MRFTDPETTYDHRHFHRIWRQNPGNLLRSMFISFVHDLMWRWTKFVTSVNYWHSLSKSNNVFVWINVVINSSWAVSFEFIERWPIRSHTYHFWHCTFNRANPLPQSPIFVSSFTFYFQSSWRLHSSRWLHAMLSSANNARAPKLAVHDLHAAMRPISRSIMLTCLNYCAAKTATVKGE